MRQKVQHWLQISAESKPEVYLYVYDSADFLKLTYVLQLLMSAGIATLGLVMNSPAVVIGGMLVSPLMGPILAAGLALASADIYLGVKAFLGLIVSSITAVAFAAAIDWLLPFQSATTEILARTQPTLLDLGVALFSGLIGAVLISRCRSGGAMEALPGVAIAVALMPPLCTVGFGIGSGLSWHIINGAGLLFLTNFAAITSSAFLTFYLVGMDDPHVREQVQAELYKRNKTDALHLFLERPGVSRGFQGTGTLRWRILMPLAILAALVVPLRQSLLQLTDDVIVRGATNEAVRNIATPESLVSQYVEITKERVILRLIVAKPVLPEKIRETERKLMQKTGREVTLAVRKVASDEELAVLKEQLHKPAPVPYQDLAIVGAELNARVGGPLKEIWPVQVATLQNFEIGFGSNEIIIRVRYQAVAPIDKTVESMMTSFLQTRLNSQKVRLELEKVTPPKLTVDNKTKKNNLKQ